MLARNVPRLHSKKRFILCKYLLTASRGSVILFHMTENKCSDCGKEMTAGTIFERRSTKNFCKVDAQVRDYAGRQLINALGETPDYEFVVAKVSGQLMNAVGLPATESDHCHNCNAFCGAEHKAWNMGAGKFGENSGGCWGWASNICHFIIRRANAHGRADIARAAEALMEVLKK